MITWKYITYEILQEKKENRLGNLIIYSVLQTKPLGDGFPHLLASCFVLSEDIEDTIFVDIKCNNDLWNTLGR